MNMAEALNIVLNLASANILDDADVDKDEELQEQVAEQNEACDMVSDLLKRHHCTDMQDVLTCSKKA